MKIPATIANLGPGFDCIGMAVTLYNFIEMDFSDTLSIEVSGEGSKSISRKEDNLVFKAAKIIFEKAGYKGGVSIKMTNNIPLARGLGSSAAAIVGGMVAANMLLGKPLKEEEILKLAVEMEGHPDNVVAALVGGITISAVYDDKIFFKKLLPPDELKVVVTIPEFELQTEKAREIIPKMIHLKDATSNISRVALLVASLVSKDFSMLQIATQDFIHQPYRKKLVSGMEEIIENAQSAGMLCCFLSGAGPSVAGFVKSEEGAKKAAEFMVKVFESKGIKANYKILGICCEGITAL
ncbi:homoserine kinase [Pseudothermotoga thermarum]|uniref:homoserine kinase n=1 Tax=Pseudothermotoga thermarum TaxID=119394 RepID=UPI001FE019D0|nr:homoserine kinase [Pseudothermotoga thermarum]